MGRTNRFRFYLPWRRGEGGLKEQLATLEDMYDIFSNFKFRFSDIKKQWLAEYCVSITAVGIVYLKWNAVYVGIGTQRNESKKKQHFKNKQSKKKENADFVTQFILVKQ